MGLRAPRPDLVDSTEFHSYIRKTPRGTLYQDEDWEVVKNAGWKDAKNLEMGGWNEPADDDEEQLDQMEEEMSDFY